MTIIVLDTNAFTRDWLVTGLKFELLEHLGSIDYGPPFTVCVPAVAFEELIANHGRAVAAAEGALINLQKERRDLGLGPVVPETRAFDYPRYLAERFDERLGFTILPLPTTAHEELVRRAVNRVAPFDKDGDGYRDALIWATVVDLAQSSGRVALVSADRAFAGPDGQLAPELLAEIEPLAGSVELVRDFKSWLLGLLPWTAVPDLETAVTLSRAADFEDYYLKSDFQDDLSPTFEDLGFNRSPFNFRVEEVGRSSGPNPVETVPALITTASQSCNTTSERSSHSGESSPRASSSTRGGSRGCSMLHGVLKLRAKLR